MDVLNELLNKDVCGIIVEYLDGGKKYWKAKYDKVLTELRNSAFVQEFWRNIGPQVLACENCDITTFYSRLHHLLQHNCYSRYEDRMKSLIVELQYYLNRKTRSSFELATIERLKEKYARMKRKQGKYDLSFVYEKLDFF